MRDGSDLHARLHQALGATYRLERELGGGGMSRVFVATEVALGRPVVIKVLHPELAAEVTAERFAREIQLAAQLQQANIVPLLAAGQLGDLPYYTMPYVDGASLRQHLLDRGHLDVPTSVGILRDVARALSYAHAAGIVHRDIKPENILLSHGAAVVTDFGIAKALSAARIGSPSGPTLTQAGAGIGTPTYMAPEQTTGERTLDHRADLYALGCVAYELLTGHPPFRGTTVAELVVSHLTEAPVPVREVRPDLPPALATLIDRCLAKDPADRPTDAATVLAALEEIRVTPVAAMGDPWQGPTERIDPARPSARPLDRRLVAAGAFGLLGIVLAVSVMRSRAAADDAIPVLAVLPFENPSRDSTLAYLEDGISDQVRDAVGRLDGIAVKARSASRHFTGRALGETGEALGASLLLLGTVSRAGPALHITAELVRPANAEALWSKSFDVAPASLAVVQDSLVRALTEALRLQQGVPSAGRGTADPYAYDQFLRGRYEADRTNWAGALRYFSRALERDPRFARAHASVAMAYSNLPLSGTGGVDSLNALARASAGFALALDSTVAEAYLALANVKVNEFAFGAAVPLMRRAVALDPGLVDARTALGLDLLLLGEVSAGLDELRRAFAADSLSSQANGTLAYGWLLAGEVDSSVMRSRAGLVIDPTNVLIHQALAQALAVGGQRAASVQAFERASELGPDRYDGPANLVYAHVLAGRRAAALAVRASLERTRGANSSNYRLAIADLALGETAAAMTALERSIASQEPALGLVSLACDPRFDPLKREPRFLALLRRLGATPCPGRFPWPLATTPASAARPAPRSRSR